LSIPEPFENFQVQLLNHDWLSQVRLDTKVSKDTFGFPPAQWELARDQARQVMIEIAKRRDTITYSELVEEVEAITFRPRDIRLFHMLGQISTAETDDGRGMLTAVVVRGDDGLPGNGFFVLAKELGFSFADSDSFWIDQLKVVYSNWPGTVP
jgi:hypothetical protein